MPLVSKSILKTRTYQKFLQDKKEAVQHAYSKIAPQRKMWINKNRYYYNQLIKRIQAIIEPDKKNYPIGLRQRPHLVRTLSKKFSRSRYKSGDD